MQHGEDELPVACCRSLVVDIAIRQRIAVFRTRMHGEAIAHSARLQDFLQFLNHGHRRVRVVLGEAAVKFAA
jgi:hypothetical protein